MLFGMNMIFGMPSILFALIGISIPLIVHLLHRRRSRRIKWGAMQFLGALPIPMARRRNLYQWLLMALRMVAIALAVLVLAQGQLSARWLPQSWRTHSPVDIALVIDHGISTGRMSQGQTVFDRSLDTVDDILRQIRAEDSVCVVMAEHAPRRVTPAPVSGSDSNALSDLLRILRRQPPALTDSSIPDAIATARQMLGNHQGRKQLVLVLSGHSRIAWHPRDAALWQSALSGENETTTDAVSIHSLPIPHDADFADAAVSDIQIEPALIGPNQPLHIQCTISNLGTHSFTANTARLWIDDVEIDNRPISPLAPKTTTLLTFDLPAGIPTTGSHRIRIGLTSTDSLAANDQALASIDVHDPLPILIVDGSFSSAGETLSSQFLIAALHPNDRSIFNPKVVTLNELTSVDLNTFAAVILNDCPALPTTVRDDLIAYTRSGHGIWCILGHRTQSDFVQTNLINTGLFPCRSSAILTAGPTGAGAIIKTPAHPITAAIATPGGNPLVGARVQKWWGIDPDDPSIQVLITTSTGNPLVMERPIGSAGGAIVLWATSADGTWNNWNLMPNFVPLVNETIRHLAAAQLNNHLPSLLTGQPIEWSFSSTRPVETASITRPDGATISVPTIANDGRQLLTYPDTFLPGFYTLRDPAASHYFAVNVDAKQLDPQLLDADDLRWLTEHHALSLTNPTVTQDQLPTIVRPREDHFQLSTTLAIFLLLVLASETALSQWMLRSNPTARSTHENKPLKEMEHAAA